VALAAKLCDCRGQAVIAHALGLEAVQAAFAECGQDGIFLGHHWPPRAFASKCANFSAHLAGACGMENSVLERRSWWGVYLAACSSKSFLNLSTSSNSTSTRAASSSYTDN